MEQFNLDKWLKNKNLKICTGDGRPVRIICIDRKGKSGNIVGLVGEDESLIYVWNNNGKHIVSDIKENDIFFADKEEELTEFEKAMIQFSHERDSLIKYGNDNSVKRCTRRYSKKLLDIARKELEKEITKEVEQKAINHTYAYQIGYENGKYDVLTGLPKWKKITKREQNYLVYGYLSHNGYYLKIQELIEKLPKEE